MQDELQVVKIKYQNNKTDLVNYFELQYWDKKVIERRIQKNKSQDNKWKSSSLKILRLIKYRVS